MKSIDPWAPIVTDDFGDIIWPRAQYGHPFYREIPSWIHYGGADDGGVRRLLFDGAFIGAEMERPIPLQEPTMMRPNTHYMGAEAPRTTPATPRRGLLADVAPLVAPATGPITLKKELDDHQVLHVEICVDGKCYQTSMDLGPAIQMVLAKLAQWHKTQHSARETPPSSVVGAIETAIGAAGDAMANTLVCRHVNVMMGSFFDDIGSAIGGTLRSLAPVISNVATGVATSYGGPAAGAAAGQLVPVVTNLQANLLDPRGDPKKRAAAQQSLQRVQQVAQTDPRAAQALSTAHQAVRDTTIAYHVKGAVDKAVSGDPAAWNDVVAVVQAAERGDPAAKSTYEVIAQTLLDKAQHSEWGAQLWEKIMGSSPATVSAGWYPQAVAVGGFWDDVGSAVTAAVMPAVTGTKMINQFVHDQKLEPYVQLAAQGVATAYGGPAAGAAASALAPSMLSLGVEDKGKAAAAQQNVQGVTAMAEQHSPQMAQAVDVAKGSIRGAATAYHIDHLLKLAKGGDKRARRALARLRSLAASGNQNAQKALQAVNTIHLEQQRTTVRGWYDIVGAVISAGGSRG